MVSKRTAQKIINLVMTLALVCLFLLDSISYAEPLTRNTSESTLASSTALPDPEFRTKFANAVTERKGRNNSVNTLAKTLPAYTEKTISALEKTNGDRTEAARILRISSQTLSRRIKDIKNAAFEIDDYKTQSRLYKALVKLPSYTEETISALERSGGDWNGAALIMGKPASAIPVRLKKIMATLIKKGDTANLSRLSAALSGIDAARIKGLILSVMIARDSESLPIMEDIYRAIEPMRLAWNRRWWPSTVDDREYESMYDKLLSIGNRYRGIFKDTRAMRKKFKNGKDISEDYIRIKNEYTELLKELEISLDLYLVMLDELSDRLKPSYRKLHRTIRMSIPYARQSHDGAITMLTLLGGDNGSANYILNDLMPAQLKEGRYYEIHYDSARLRKYQEDLKISNESSPEALLKAFVKLLRDRVAQGDPNKVIKLVENPSGSGKEEDLISVKCFPGSTKTGRPGEGRVNIKGDLKGQTLDVVGLLNMAVAASGIRPDVEYGKMDGSEQKLIAFIKSQCKSFTGSDIPEDKILEFITNLPPVIRVPASSLSDYYRFTIHHLRQYA